MALALVAAALLVFVPGVAACGGSGHPAASQSAAPSTTTTPAPPEPAAALPPPEALTDVLYKLADTSVPGAQKAGLIEGATADDGAQIDRFGKALQDDQYTPLEFTAENVGWSDSVPGNVTADVAVHSQNPALVGGFTFPMEFRPFQDGWQLSRTTADILLTVGQNQTATATPTPTPTG